MKAQPLICHYGGCNHELVEPEFSIKPFLPAMQIGRLSVVDDINRAYSQAVRQANRDHFHSHGEPAVERGTQEATDA